MTSSLDLAGTGTIPAGTHRMLDQRVRIRVLVLVAVLGAASWGAIAALGSPSCPAFTARETRELAGLPVPPSCVSERIAPGASTNPVDRLTGELDNNQPFPGESP